MSLQTLKDQKGFTIVELLIVIVVIGILAAITIVAFNGIQNRGKATSAQSLASGIAKKVEVYNTDPDTTGYPSTLADLTGAATTAPYYVASDSVVPATSFAASNNDVAKRVVFQVCGHNGAATAAGSAANVIAGTKTGARVGHWSGSGTGVTYINVGTIAHTGTPSTSNPFIACYNSNS
jgi:prepilin-type N-terminal cleavage/methylation domain-containing protein